MIKLKKSKIASVFARKANDSHQKDQVQLSTPKTTTAVSATAEATDATMAVKTNDQQSNLFHLNIDCIAKIFDYLSFNDLINCAQTCKLMQTVAGHIFQLYYPLANAIVDDGHIYVDVNGIRYDIDILTEYVKSVMFTNVMCDRSNGNPDAIQWHQFKSITHVNFYYARFNAQQIRLIANILHQAETIVLSNCQFDDGLFPEFLAMCHRPRQLIIGMTYNCGVSWLHGQYPTLQHVGIWPILRSCGELQELRQFLHQNPNIESIVVSLKFLFDNKQSIMATKIHDLHIVLDDVNFQAFFSLIRDLYENGAYQRFHMKFFEYLDLTQQLIDQLPTINGLVGFRVPFNASDMDLNSLVNLEILQFACGINQIKNAPQLAQNLTQLKEIYFHKASIGDILPFVLELTKLRKISVEKFMNNNGSQWINLHAINEQRKRLRETTTNHVSKVTLFMVEEIYLRTRVKSISMNLQYVEMQRFEREYKCKF